MGLSFGPPNSTNTSVSGRINPTETYLLLSVSMMNMRRSRTIEDTNSGLMGRTKAARFSSTQCSRFPEGIAMYTDARQPITALLYY
jgi:hypothetical protein